ncbi:potassium voltage-gated channel subfamily C member 3-like [Haliotis rufescens]|uniref:potassium voltage-gated channel subfamily C member 3-like n=1 Tax=Haliotis rufescens TaxID=6454 RepID=UPI001EB06C15|nr:potassium voltage-gated channel subfamily C member 3-like [Haliotis rufescens]
MIITHATLNMSAYVRGSKDGQRFIVDEDDVGNTPLKVRRQSLTDDEEIVLNVGGVRHETHASTLQNVPNTRLSRLAENHLLGGGKEEYFFDRHPAVFNSIIDFYRTGELHVPLEVCGAVVKRELDFWQMNEHEIKACCWRHYRSYIENQRILDSFDSSLQKENFNVDLNVLTGWKYWQTKIWLILDHPRTSRLAMIYGITSFLFVALSIAGFCLETLPDLRPVTNVTTKCNGVDSISSVITSHEALNIIDLICTVFFTLELILRFTVAPNKLKFVRSPMNIIDLLALVPLYVQIIFERSDQKACYLNERLVIEILFILRIIRMFRIFHLVKHYQALKVLVYALKASLQELLMLFIFLMIGMLVFATMIYYTERKDATNPSDTFNTIPVGFWWAIITMTTVGYGDIYPRTPIGYIVGTACSVCGVLLVALTFPVISNNFSLFYTHVRSRSQAPRRIDAESKDPLTQIPFSPVTDRPPSVASTVVEPYMNGNARDKGSDKTSPIVVSRMSRNGSISDVIMKNIDSSYSLHQNGSAKTRSDDGGSCQGETHV